MFQQCYGMQGSKFDKQIHLGATPPKSVADYISEKGLAEGSLKRKQEEALAKFRQDEQEAEDLSDRDELDDLLLEETESQIQQPVAPKRLPGCTQGTLGRPGPTPQKIKGQGEKSEKGPRSLGSTTTTTPKSVASITMPMAASASPTAEASVQGPPSLSCGKASASLDADMQMVANKHMETEGGSSSKALHGLEPSFFLIKSDRRYGQSGKLRGVTRLVQHVHMCVDIIYIYI